jgi:hypothetical protein
MLENLDYASAMATNNDDELAFLQHAVAHAGAAQVAAFVMLTEVLASATGIAHPDLAEWRKVIPPLPPEVCRSMDDRRPECAEVHTHDCEFYNPPPHVMLEVGTRVLVSDWRRGDDGRLVLSNPQPGRISGYDTYRTKYRWQFEIVPGSYSDVDQWSFMDDRVQVHPDGSECPPPPQPVKQEPTGPRIYVHNSRGTSGHVLATRREEGVQEAQVQWHRPGESPAWVPWSMLKVTHDVARCPNGQTGDECGSGENQCELCLQAEDAEAEEIERSMGLRND